MDDATNFGMYGRSPLVSSAEKGWPELRVERFQLDATELPAHFHPHHLIVLHQGDQPVYVQRQNGHQLEEARFRAGDMGLYPAGEYGPSSWNGPVDTIHLQIDVQLLEERAREGLNLTHFALEDRFQFDDGMITQLGLQLLMVAGSTHSVGRLYTESLINTLSYHLIEHHATYQRRIAQPAGVLPVAVIARIDTYIEAFSEAPITLEAMAGLANLSVFHFARCFRLTTGLSPYQYVLAWKIKRACAMLRADKMPITTIIDLLGFGSSSHFSTAFKRAVGQTPREFQRSHLR